MHSRLPIAVPPAHHETAGSYVQRLATLHGLPLPELWEQVSHPRRPGSTSRLVALDRLAAVTGHPASRLARAVIDLRRPEPDWLAYRHTPQPGCPRCTARHRGGIRLQLLAHHHYVCTRHQLWIGPPDPLFHRPPHLADLPEIVVAQRAHLRLLHRHGPAATYDAVLTGFLICAHRWDAGPTGDTDVWHSWTRRTDLLIPPGTEGDTFSASRLFAATYPEAVKIAAPIASLHWRRLAGGNPAGQRRFAAEIAHRLGHPDYHPKVSQDPIAHWIDQDCWRPPSAPTHTYRGSRYDRARAPKADAGAHDRHDRSARWFSWKRTGGKTMLFHRTLAPVVIRDWSPHLELFVGAVEATASSGWATPDVELLTSTTPSTYLPQIADYIRRDPAPSDYLRTATTPLPWDQPENRPTRLSRPLSRSERDRQRRSKARRPQPQTAPAYKKWP